MRTIALLVAFLASAPLAHAQEKLWNERSGSARALAQVPDFAALAKQVIPAVVAIIKETDNWRWWTATVLGTWLYFLMMKGF